MLDFIDKIMNGIFNFLDYMFSTRNKKIISISIIVFLIVGGVFANAYYENTRLKHGQVYDKEYDPPSTTWTYINDRMTAVHNAATWTLKYRVYDDVEGKFRNGEQQVDETTYHKFEVGDDVDFRKRSEYERIK